MADREKVIKGLEQCGIGSECIGRNCPYWHNVLDDAVKACNCTTELVRDALALLKEQEAKPPALMQDAEGIWSTCSTCGHKLRPILSMKMDTYIPKFCSKCGQAVKWMPLPEPPPERKTAHWVFGNTMGHSWMKCSECCVSQSGQTGCWSYCPNCGAEMKGETEVEID